MSREAARLLALFGGSDDAHGTHGLTERNDRKGGKLEIKKTARTLRGGPTEELWDQHVAGSRPLGVVPVRSDGTCRWGCIDVDRYDLDLGAEVKRLQSKKLPLVVCRSKSGGAHVFLFMRDWTPVTTVQPWLREVAASLGWGNCEVFPKQSRTLVERGDLGNWLNMPYLGGDATERYAVKKTGMAMTLAEFLDAAEAAQVAEEDLRQPRQQKKEGEEFSDGPPCLQHLVSIGQIDHPRNNALFAFGVYAKKKYPTDWRHHVERYNRDLMSPPLEAGEVLQVIQSLDRKEYSYPCSEQPCVSHCNLSLCRTRKHGVGGAMRFPVITGISKLDTRPDPIWFVDVEEERVELTTTQLQRYTDFQRACMDQLSITFESVKQTTWIAQVGEAMSDVNIIEPPPEANVSGIFLELLEEFCVNRNRAVDREDILRGQPWLDEDAGRHYFRLRDLMSFLSRESFTAWGRNKVSSYIETTMGGGRQFFVLRGHGTNTHWVPSFETPGPAPVPRAAVSPM